jgi:ribosomal protein L11 methyltransferase
VSGQPGWIAFRITTGGDRDAVIAALFAAGSQGIFEDGDAIVTHFPPGTDASAVAAAVREAEPDVHVDAQELPAIDWAEAWKTRVGAHELGGLAVVPPWLAEGRDPARTIVIEPQMAFGTGEHATTRGVVRLMQGVIRPGDVVADLGAGSAVLSIAAAKLGATRVAAIEIDGEAIPNAEENVRRNGVEDRVRVLQGDAAALLPLLAPVRVILANIISSVITELLPAMEASLAPDGRLVASGILQEESAHMLELFRAGGWTLEAEDREDVWWSGLLTRR